MLSIANGSRAPSMLSIANGSPECAAAVFKRSPETAAGRFNAGQKLNFMLVTVLFAALFVTGIGLTVTGSHPVNPVFKAAHIVAECTALVLVAGHLYMALINPSTRPALRGRDHRRREIHDRRDRPSPRRRHCLAVGLGLRHRCLGSARDTRISCRSRVSALRCTATGVAARRPRGR
jgi:hypothetical protein